MAESDGGKDSESRKLEIRDAASSGNSTLFIFERNLDAKQITSTGDRHPRKVTPGSHRAGAHGTSRDSSRRGSEP